MFVCVCVCVCVFVCVCASTYCLCNLPHTSNLQLESVERLNQTEWKTEVVLPSVSFAPLILPSQESVKDLKALEIGEEIQQTPHLSTQ